MNVFREILKTLPKGKITVIPDDPKDEKIAKQMTDMVNFKVVRSKSDKHPEYGYPMGQILCRNQKEAEEHIKKSPYNDLYIQDY